MKSTSLQIKHGDFYYDFSPEAIWEIKTRLRVAIRLTDGMEIQSILSDTLQAWEVIDEKFLEHNRQVKGPDVDPEVEKALNRIIKIQLQCFRTDEVMDT